MMTQTHVYDDAHVYDDTDLKEQGMYMMTKEMYASACI